MKRWQEILEEAPSASLERSILDKANAEMKALRGAERRDFWRKLLFAAVPAVSAIAAVFWLKPNPRQESEVDPEFLDLVFADDDLSEEDMESLEDIFVLEHLEELEEWNS